MMHLFFIFPISHSRHVVINNSNHISTCGELMVKNVVPDAAQIALNSWRTFDNVGPGIGGAIGGGFGDHPYRGYADGGGVYGT